MADYIRSLRKHIGNELLLMPSITAVVLNEQNQILCIRRSDNDEWDIPGGYIELGEQPAQAAAREVFEETGLKVRPERLIGVFGNLHAHYPNGDKVEFVTTVFLCRILSGELKPRDGEATKLQFFNIYELPSSPLFDRLYIPFSEQLRSAHTSFVWQDNWLDSLV